MRVSLAAAAAWVDAQTRSLGEERVAIDEALGRRLARPLVAPADLPATPRAATDGIALRADETVGASTYNPLSFRLLRAGELFASGTACIVAAGQALPPGADAVVPREQVSLTGDAVEIVEPAIGGSEIEQVGSLARRGAALLEPGRRLGAAELALAATVGATLLPVVRRPVVRVIVSGPRQGEIDADGPLLGRLIERDGGVVALQAMTKPSLAALADALRLSGVDLVLVAGGSGQGEDDHAAAALAAAGTLAWRGVALSPGESGSAGIVGVTPVLLLPGPPVACLWFYELVAGRAVRRLAGGDGEWPFIAEEMIADRKLVSAIGVSTILPVRRCGAGRVEPLGPFRERGLVAMVQADGIVLLPEGSEGVPQGNAVTVYRLPRGR